jgi:hypothetical protein
MFIEFSSKLETKQNMEALICIKYYKMTFTLRAAIKSKSREIQFRGLF